MNSLKPGVVFTPEITVEGQAEQLQLSDMVPAAHIQGEPRSREHRRVGEARQGVSRFATAADAPRSAQKLLARARRVITRSGAILRS